MENNKATPSQEPRRIKAGKLIILNVQIALGIAIVLATLFTAWTPGESSQTPSWEISQIAPLPTPLPPLVPTSTPHLRPLIGIVSGHWGNDSGAICADGLKEADVNQNIAAQVQKKLVEKGFDVDLLKEFDPRLRGYKALALVSIHADSCAYINEQATGYKVAAALASPDREKATRLTACLRARYGQASGLDLHSTSVTTDMTNYHAFDEIDPETPAAIIETGFLNLDRQFLVENSNVAADGIVNGILCFINNEDIANSETSNP
jgi:N-acetylmuramoyl-L-alanine amidase